MDAPLGARRATCRTARFSVMLIFSPRNMASMRPRKSGFLGQLQEQFQGLVGDAILRVIQVQADRLDRHALAACGIIRKKFAQMQLTDIF